MSAIALETKSVIKTYRLDGQTIHAVDQVSLQVQAGEFVALVGPSGSGKTTLLAILAALLSPSSGEVLVDGQDLAKMKDAQRVSFRREKIGFTFQANNLVPYLTAQENVELMLRLNSRLDRAGRERARELLVRLGLGERLHNLPSQMSGGQQQRVAIARALVTNPPLLLADEPTGNLDTRTSHEVLALLQALSEDYGITVVIVTHEADIAACARRVITVRDGRIFRDERNANPRVAAAVESRP